MSDKPNLDGIFGSATNPLRLIFMMGIIWRLAQDRRTDRLKMLEIGSWCGASALAWGEAIGLYFQGRGDLTCIDPWDPYMDIAVNLEEADHRMNDALADGTPFEVFRANMKFLPAGVGLDIRRGRSKDILPTLAPSTFDLIYIDGDHTYAAVAADIAGSIDLVRDGGVLCGDDLELQADECDTSIVEREPAREGEFDEPTQTFFHPGVTKAVGERFGRVSCWHGFWAMQKTGEAWRPVSLAGMPARIPSHIPPHSLIGLKAALMKEGLL